MTRGPGSPQHGHACSPGARHVQPAPHHRPVCVALLCSPLLRLLGLALLFEGLRGGLLSALASALVLRGHVAPASSPPLDSSDSGLTRCLWQEARLRWLRGGVSYVDSHRSPGLCWSIRSRPSLRPTSAGLHTFLAQGRRRTDEGVLFHGHLSPEPICGTGLRWPPTSGASGSAPRGRLRSLASPGECRYGAEATNPPLRGC